MRVDTEGKRMRQLIAALMGVLAIALAGALATQAAKAQSLYPAPHPLTPQGEPSEEGPR